MMECFYKNITAKSCSLFLPKCFIIDFDIVLNTPLRLCWRKLCITPIWTLQKILLHRDITRYQKQHFVHVLLTSHSQKLRKIHRNAPAPESFFNLQSATLLKKKTPSYIFFRDFLETTLLRRTSCKLGLKGEVYEKWRTGILIIKRYLKVNSSFIEQT